MTVSDWAAILALGISSAALALELRHWFESRPRLRLSVMADASTLPFDDKKQKLALTVINRGGAPTMLTHMVDLIEPQWGGLRGRRYYAGIVKAPEIPAELGINKTWTGLMIYDKETIEGRKKGHLYVGVIASHSNSEFLIRVPPKRADIPNKIIGGSHSTKDVP